MNLGRFSLIVTVLALSVPKCSGLSANAIAPKLRPPFVFGAYPHSAVMLPVVATRHGSVSFTAVHLPSGLVINRATGAITGVASRAGVYHFTVDVANSVGRSSHQFTLTVGDHVALTPPMGWNSYDYYGDRVNQAQMLINAQYVHRYLQDIGWNTIVVDYRWYDGNADPEPDNGAPGESLSMDKYGRLIPAADRFPSAGNGNGFRLLAHHLHAMGLRFGIHIMRGIPRLAVEENLPIAGSKFHARDAANVHDNCSWCPDMYGVRGDTPAGRAYYLSIFKLYASWGVDFVKMDDTSQPYHRDEIDAVHDAILHCGRTITLSLSPGETPIQDAMHVELHANMWRVSGDFWDNWNSLNHEFTLARRWQAYVGPGHWPDADMLPVGHLSMGGRPVGPDRMSNFSMNEQRMLLSFWSLLPSPLMAGGFLPDLPLSTREMLTNSHLIAINQDSAGIGARLVGSAGPTEVWVRPLSNGKVAVGMFNRSDRPVTMTVPLADLSLKGRVLAYNVWKRSKMNLTNKEAIKQSVGAHDAALFILIPTVR